ncbi:restriction endonuclease subunit S [Xylocopilactobacillus apicola]|uniref:restriction endonuclease subunit S n=1 Tax=Xylocopilactobacillus apicola TaxID=2932184 RepID=UPI003CE5AA8D
MNWKFFYQEAPTIVSNEVAVLSNEHLNEYNGLFIATVLRNTIEQTLWHRQNIKSSLRTQQINLPVDGAGKVDWNFMDEYIKSIPNSNLIKRIW